jgi:hypothetical protein
MKLIVSVAIVFAWMFCGGCSKQNEMIEDRFVYRISHDMLMCYAALVEGDKKIDTLERQHLADIMILQFVFLTSEEPYLASQHQVSAIRRACRRVAVLLKLELCKEVDLKDRVYIGPKGKKETLRQQVEKQIQRIPADELKEMTEKMTKLWTK